MRPRSSRVGSRRLTVFSDKGVSSTSCSRVNLCISPGGALSLVRRQIQFRIMNSERCAVRSCSRLLIRASSRLNPIRTPPSRVRARRLGWVWLGIECAAILQLARRAGSGYAWGCTCKISVILGAGCAGSGRAVRTFRVRTNLGRANLWLQGNVSLSNKVGVIDCSLGGSHHQTGFRRVREVRRGARAVSGC